MSKQETVNTFDGGLVMDLNPMTTPNNVVTDCLNSTMITYDGNEFILQMTWVMEEWKLPNWMQDIFP